MRRRATPAATQPRPTLREHSLPHGAQASAATLVPARCRRLYSRGCSPSFDRLRFEVFVAARSRQACSSASRSPAASRSIPSKPSASNRRPGTSRDRSSRCGSCWRRARTTRKRTTSTGGRSRSPQPNLAVWSLRKAMEDPEWLVPAGSQLAFLALAGDDFNEVVKITGRILEREPGERAGPADARQRVRALEEGPRARAGRREARARDRSRRDSRPTSR